MAKSTMNTMSGPKEAIRSVGVAKGVKVLTKQGSQATEEVENLLLIWIKAKQLAGDTTLEAMT